MSTNLDLDLFRDIPGYKGILKAVLKSQIQLLIHQLSESAGEESVLLSANLGEGTISHLGSDSGKNFLLDFTDVKRQFLGYCLKKHQATKYQFLSGSSPRGTTTTTTCSSSSSSGRPLRVSTESLFSHRKTPYRKGRRSSLTTKPRQQLGQVYTHLRFTAKKEEKSASREPPAGVRRSPRQSYRQQSSVDDSVQTADDGEIKTETDVTVTPEHGPSNQHLATSMADPSSSNDSIPLSVAHGDDGTTRHPSNKRKSFHPIRRTKDTDHSDTDTSQVTMETDAVETEESAVSMPTEIHQTENPMTTTSNQSNQPVFPGQRKTELAPVAYPGDPADILAKAAAANWNEEKLFNVSSKTGVLSSPCSGAAKKSQSNTAAYTGRIYSPSMGLDDISTPELKRANAGENVNVNTLIAASGNYPDSNTEDSPPNNSSSGQYMKTPQIDGLLVSRGEGRYEKLIRCETCGKVCRTSNMSRHKRRYCTGIPGLSSRTKQFTGPGKNESTVAANNNAIMADMTDNTGFGMSEALALESQGTGAENWSSGSNVDNSLATMEHETFFENSDSADKLESEVVKVDEFVHTDGTRVTIKQEPVD